VNKIKKKSCEFGSSGDPFWRNKKKKTNKTRPNLGSQKSFFETGGRRNFPPQLTGKGKGVFWGNLRFFFFFCFGFFGKKKKLFFWGKKNCFYFSLTRNTEIWDRGGGGVRLGGGKKNRGLVDKTIVSGNCFLAGGVFYQRFHRACHFSI